MNEFGRVSRIFPPIENSPLGHTKIESTVRYLGIEVDDALAIAVRVGRGRR
jgi:hypothetical protein